MRACRVVIACLLAVVVESSAPSGVFAQADDSALPRNYRQLIIQTILAHTDARTIRRARISEPQVIWMGLLHGGNRRAICVEVIRETPITSDARDVWAFTFKDGRVETAMYLDACKGYSPFNELLKQK